MKAIERSKQDYNQPFFKKEGRRYIPVTDPYAYYGLKEGYWLVGVKPGQTSIREMVHPANAEVEAAIREKEEKIIPIIREIFEARPRRGREISQEALKDWNELVDRHGDEFRYLEYPSIQEVAEKIIEKLMER